jgi:hypothetical protein
VAIANCGFPPVTVVPDTDPPQVISKQPHRALLGRTLFTEMILVYDGRDGSVRLAI